MLTKRNDAVKGERLICQFRKESKAVLVPLTSGHRGTRRVLIGYPAIAIVDKEWQRGSNQRVHPTR